MTKLELLNTINNNITLVSDEGKVRIFINGILSPLFYNGLTGKWNGKKEALNLSQDTINEIIRLLKIFGEYHLEKYTDRIFFDGIFLALQIEWGIFPKNNLTFEQHGIGALDGWGII